MWHVKFGVHCLVYAVSWTRKTQPATGNFVEALLCLSFMQATLSPDPNHKKQLHASLGSLTYPAEQHGVLVES